MSPIFLFLIILHAAEYAAGMNGIDLITDKQCKKEFKVKIHEGIAGLGGIRLFFTNHDDIQNAYSYKLKAANGQGVTVVFPHGIDGVNPLIRREARQFTLDTRASLGPATKTVVKGARFNANGEIVLQDLSRMKAKSFKVGAKIESQYLRFTFDQEEKQLQSASLHIRLRYVIHDREENIRTVVKDKISINLLHDTISFFGAKNGAEPQEILDEIIKQEKFVMKLDAELEDLLSWLDHEDGEEDLGDGADLEMLVRMDADDVEADEQPMCLIM